MVVAIIEPFVTQTNRKAVSQNWEAAVVSRHRRGQRRVDAYIHNGVSMLPNQPLDTVLSTTGETSDRQCESRLPHTLTTNAFITIGRRFPREFDQNPVTRAFLGDTNATIHPRGVHVVLGQGSGEVRA